MSKAPGEGPDRKLALRGARKQEVSGHRNRRVASDWWHRLESEDSEANKEELNEFAAEHADMEAEVVQLGNAVKTLREQLETIRREKNEEEASVAQQVEIRGTEGSEGKRGESDVGSLEEAEE
jgi:hypothetical protein